MKILIGCSPKFKCVCSDNSKWYNELIVHGGVSSRSHASVMSGQWWVNHITKMCWCYYSPPIHSHTAVHASSDVSRCCQVFHDVITLVCRRSGLDRTEVFLRDGRSTNVFHLISWVNPLKSASILNDFHLIRFFLIRLSRLRCPPLPTLISVKVKFDMGHTGFRS